MTALERAKAMIHTMPTGGLLDVWEMTTDRAEPHIPMVRGWIMDEFERRHPAAFAAWMDEETPEDKDLRKYIKEVK